MTLPNMATNNDAIIESLLKDGPAALAPMAGVSDVAMRRLCARFGASYTVSEMVSAKALVMKDKKSRSLIYGGGGSAPYGVQLFGHEPEVMAGAVAEIDDEDFDFLDINMGCPAPKICGHGDGSALLRTPQLAGQVAEAAVRASRRPVTAKLRIGWDDDQLTGVEVAKRCEAAGVRLLAVHGRTRMHQYKPGVNYEAVAQIKQAVSLPVLYNGDVETAEGALYALERTGCDGVMIGRGAIGNPFVFGEVRAALTGQPAPAPISLSRRLAMLDEQVRIMCEEKGEDRAMREARKVAAGYLRGLRGAAALRREAHALTFYTDLARLTRLAYDYNP